MAIKRARSICLACQARQALIGRRRIFHNKRRDLETAALPPSKRDTYPDKTISSSIRRRRADEVDCKQTAVGVGAELPSWGHITDQPDGVQEALQNLEIMWREKDKRIRILTSLSNPWPTPKRNREYHERRKHTGQARTLELPEANAAPIPHAVFRERLARTTSEKEARQILRAQLLRCEVPHDVRRVIATALVMNKHTRQFIGNLHEPIMRALYRCRNRVDDVRVLQTLMGIQDRFQVHGVRVDPQLVALGLKFAARTRSVRYMKRYLKAFRDANLKMTSNIYRAVIAKCSIGHRGLGEIRNGRWLQSDLLQVLTGFDDCRHLPLDQQYHLGAYLVRDDWQYLHGWIAVLARCKAVSAIWKEWQLWKLSDARSRPRKLSTEGFLVNTKSRGDYWFVEQMCYAAGLREAWQILAESEIDFRILKARIKLRMLDGLEHCPESVWRAHREVIRAELIRKCEVEFANIERALSVAWIPTDLDDEAIGYHVLIEPQEQVLDRLGDGDYKFEEDFGYPYETLVSPKERGLHDAVEEGFIEPHYDAMK